jgi:hypothetical protein
MQTQRVEAVEATPKRHKPELSSDDAKMRESSALWTTIFASLVFDAQLVASTVPPPQQARPAREPSAQLRWDRVRRVMVYARELRSGSHSFTSACSAELLPLTDEHFAVHMCCGEQVCFLGRATVPSDS